ncbi:MAG TPA: hypothetical protein PK157_22425, partial [Bryobacteraceae bacterium]|nr:hypothetical protein [Bryobacteraceae bacterium]
CSKSSFCLNREKPVLRRLQLRNLRVHSGERRLKLGLGAPLDAPLLKLHIWRTHLCENFFPLRLKLCQGHDYAPGFL